MVQAMKFYKNFLSLNSIFWCLFIFVSAVIIWSIFFELNKSIVADGQVSPEGRAVKVQNIYQGTIAKVLVEVGDDVSSQDVLIRLSTSKEDQKLQYLKQRQRAEGFKAARLSSILNLPGGLESLQQEDDGYYQIQKNILKNDELVFQAKLDSLKLQINASKIQLNLLTSRLPILDKRVILAQTKLNLVSEMKELGYEGDINVLSMEAEYNDALDKIITLKNEIDLRKNEIAQFKSEIVKLRNDRRASASSEYYEISKELDQISSEISDIELFLSESLISAPISGTVSRVLYENVGQVIDPGTTLAEILPANTQNVFYVEIAAASISEVTLGQKARVSLANMDTRKNQNLDGVLVKLDGDITEAEDGRRFYSGIVEFDDPNSEFLVPGVAGTVSLDLGKRSVFMYLFDPILDVVLNSLRE